MIMTLENFLQDQKQWYSAKSNDELYQNRSEEGVIQNYVIQVVMGVGCCFAPFVLRRSGIELSDAQNVILYIPGVFILADSLTKNFRQGSLIGAVNNLYRAIRR